MTAAKLSGSSRHGLRRASNDADTKPQEVRVPAGAPRRPLSDEVQRELAELAELPDSQIDLSEMPEWTDEMFARAVQGKFYRPLKSQLTVRLDNDVLAWLKAEGKGYQTRINAILRRAMLDDLAGK
jgi:uncharacterized protein (DUF4415 family)